MSTQETGELQRARLDELGLAVTELEHLRDVDTIEDARAVAAQRPGSSFGRTLARMGLERRAAAGRGDGSAPAPAR